MKHSILEKLNKELCLGISQEKDVIYILAEVRKYLEAYEKTRSFTYKNLYFACNWVLHIEMDRTPAKELLNDFEKIVGDTTVVNCTQKSLDFIREKLPFYTFAELRKELGIFLREHQLPEDLVINNISWNRFVSLLLKVITDCPLKNKGCIVSEFSFISSTFSGDINFQLVIRGNKLIVTLQEADRVHMEFIYS